MEIILIVLIVVTLICDVVALYSLGDVFKEIRSLMFSLKERTNAISNAIENDTERIIKSIESRKIADMGMLDIQEGHRYLITLPGLEEESTEELVDFLTKYFSEKKAEVIILLDNR